MSYQSVVSGQTPLRYFRLQDALTDEQGGASLVRAAGGQEPQYATGYVDTSPRGLSFDGGDSASVGSVAWGSPKASITLWFKPTSFSSTQVWFESSADYNGVTFSSSSARMIAYSDGTNLNVNVCAAAAGAAAAFDTTLWPLPSTGAWTHVAIVFDLTASTTGRIKVYYNGSLQTVSSPSWQTTNVNFSTQDLYVMSRAGSAYFQGAVIDDIAVWGGTALSAAQVSAQYAAGAPPVAAPATRRRSLGLYTR